MVVKRICWPTTAGGLGEVVWGPAITGLLPSGSLVHVIEGVSRTSAFGCGLASPLTETVTPSVVSLAGGATVAMVICVGLFTVAVPSAITARLGVVRGVRTLVAGQDVVAAEVVVNPVPVMVTLLYVCPANQTFGDMDVIVGLGQ